MSCGDVYEFNANCECECTVCNELRVFERDVVDYDAPSVALKLSYSMS